MKEMKKGEGEHRSFLKSALPDDLCRGARATLMARSSVMVEAQHGVVQLGRTCIRLRTDDGILCVLGSGLALRELSLDTALITGEVIDTLTYGCVRHGEEEQ